MRDILSEEQYGTFNMGWNQLFTLLIGTRLERMFWQARRGLEELGQEERR
jgi:hypothetical protein